MAEANNNRKEFIKQYFKEKNKEIRKYSTPEIVQQRAYEALGPDAHVIFSFDVKKKYSIYDGEKWVSFGQMGYEDFTKHNDERRRARYLKRAENIKGNWRENPYSPNNLSINLLW